MLQFLHGDTGNRAELPVIRRTALGQQPGHNPLGRSHIPPVEHRQLLLHSLNVLALGPVYAEQPVGHRFGAHGIDGRLYLGRLIRLAHHVETAGDFLGSQFLGKIPDAQDLLLSVGHIFRKSVQSEVRGYAHLYCQFLDIQGNLLRSGCIRRLPVHSLVVARELLREVAVDSPHIAFHERSGEVGLQSRVCPPLGHDSLPHVGDGVQVEMRDSAHQTVRPVVLAQGHLLAGSEL